MPAIPHTVAPFVGYRAFVATVIAQTAYPLRAASARVRLASFAPFLAARGVDLEYRPALTDGQYAVMVNGRRPDRRLRSLAASIAAVANDDGSDPASLVLVHRLRSLVPVPVLEFSTRVDVYDFDDAMFAGSGPGTAWPSRMIKAEARRWRRYVGMARLVLAGNEYLAGAARERSSRVEVVPSCVDPTLYRVREHGDSSPVTTGWIGSPATSGFLKPLLPVFERLNRDRVRVRLLTVGASPLPPSRWLVQRPWSLEREAADLAEFDVGIMPLPDTTWTRGKCGYKVLQYFAAGVPVIASPVGVSPRLIGQARGALADSVSDWTAAVSELAADAEARRQMGAAGRRLVEREYSYQRWAPELAGMLSSLTI
jgi:glycosyltransferase involved in cell wall biosynthesis